MGLNVCFCDPFNELTAETRALYDYIFALGVKCDEVSIVADELRDLVNQENRAIMEFESKNGGNQRD